MDRPIVFILLKNIFLELLLHKPKNEKILKKLQVRLYIESVHVVCYIYKYHHTTHILIHKNWDPQKLSI